MNVWTHCGCFFRSASGQQHDRQVPPLSTGARIGGVSQRPTESGWWFVEVSDLRSWEERKETKRRDEKTFEISHRRERVFLSVLPPQGLHSPWCGTPCGWYTPWQVPVLCCQQISHALCLSYGHQAQSTAKQEIFVYFCVFWNSEPQNSNMEIFLCSIDTLVATVTKIQVSGTSRL